MTNRINRYDQDNDGGIEQIDADAVGTTELAADAVTSAKIATGAVGPVSRGGFDGCLS